MTTLQVSIGQVKRDISSLVNQVAYGGQRVILTSRNKPKAAIVSIADYEQLLQLSAEASLSRWENWLNENERLSKQILARRQGEALDVDALWQSAKNDLETRDEQTIGN